MATFGVLRRISRDRVIVAVLCTLAVAAVGFLISLSSQTRPSRLRLAAGDPKGQRFAMARTLAGESRSHRVALEIVPTSGSIESLDRLEAGKIDLAMIQGGLDLSGRKHLLQVAALHVEPLHLLVKGPLADAVTRDLNALHGHTVNLGEPRSGTRSLAIDVMRFAGMKPDVDFRDFAWNYERLETEDDLRRLPDAVFTVSLLPSPVAQKLVGRHGYRLVPLPFAEAYALNSPVPTDGALPSDSIRRDHVIDAIIPAYTYGYGSNPTIASDSVHTLGTRMLLVAREDTDPEAIARVLEAAFAATFAQIAHPPLTMELLELPRELPVHSGTLRFLERRKPLITGDVIDAVEKQLSIAGALITAAFFLWQWLKVRYRRLRHRGMEHYILEVAEIETAALRLELSPTLDLSALISLQDDLGRVKSEALAKFAEGELEGQDLLSGFLTHASDARDHLTRLILHCRDALERQARLESRDAISIWHEALTSNDAPPSADEVTPSIATG